MRKEDEISLVSSIPSMDGGGDDDKRNNCGCLPIFQNNSASCSSYKDSSKSHSPSLFLRSSPRNNRMPVSFKDTRITSHVIPTSLTDPEISDRDRKVPMDFSLPKAKIVSDPEELMNVLREEHMRTKEKFRLHSPDSRIPQLSCYLIQPWFHQGLSRESANELLKHHQYKEGTFLIRLSNRLPGCFVLSVAHNNAVHHYPISSIRNDDGESLLTLDGGRTKFRDLIQLVNFYEVNNGGLLPTLLLNYIAQSVSLTHHTNTLCSPSSL